MTQVLITGATGNVGTEVIKSLQNIDHPLDLYAGVRDLIADISDQQLSVHWIIEALCRKNPDSNRDPWYI